MLNAYLRVRNKMDELMRQEDGASLVEYGLLVALIAVVAIAGVTALGTNVGAKFSSLATTIAGGS